MPPKRLIVNQIPETATKDEGLKKFIVDTINETVRKYMVSGGFTERKLTDTPTDALSVVNRRFVTANGVTGSRPASPTVGQFYFDTTLGYPIWFDGSDWVDSSGDPA